MPNYVTAWIKLVVYTGLISVKLH